MAVGLRLEANLADVKAAAEEFVSRDELPPFGVVLSHGVKRSALDASAGGDVVLVVTGLGFPGPVRAEDKVQVRGVNALGRTDVAGLLIAIDGDKPDGGVFADVMSDAQDKEVGSGSEFVQAVAGGRVGHAEMGVLGLGIEQADGPRAFFPGELRAKQDALRLSVGQAVLVGQPRANSPREKKLQRRGEEIGALGEKRTLLREKYHETRDGDID